MKEILLVACKCGRIRKRDNWIYVQYPFSVFVVKFIANGDVSIKIFQKKCPYCQERKSASE